MTTAGLNTLNPLILARAAQCAEPASPASTGSAFLSGIRDDMATWIDDGGDPADSDAVTTAAAEIAEHQTATGTRTFWEVFTELAAYRETPESGEWPGDLSRAAGIALEQIAIRLCLALARLAQNEAPR